MAKKRLIDADALWNKFESEPWYNNADRDEIALPLVDDAPTVDAVEVVRCRECKYWNKDALACDTLPWENSSEHANWYENDFCSYGERKDGNENGKA